MVLVALLTAGELLVRPGQSDWWRNFQAWALNAAIGFAVLQNDFLPKARPADMFTEFWYRLVFSTSGNIVPNSTASCWVGWPTQRVSCSPDVTAISLARNWPSDGTPAIRAGSLDQPQILHE